MRLVFLSTALICLLGAAALWLKGDPWARASLKGAADAQAIAEVQHQPDRIGFFLGQDVALLKAVVWAKDGSVLYPGQGIYVPTRYDLSGTALEELTRLTSAGFQTAWSDYDRDSRQLLYCQTAPRICLIYDRTELQNTLQAALTGWRQGAMALMAVLGVLCLALSWRRGAAARFDDHLVLLPDQHSARRGRLEVALTPRDLRLLAFLQTRQGTVVTKDALYDAGWGRDFMPNSRALDQHMINLRKKLDPDKSRAPVIETVRGVGYKLLK